MRKTVDGRAKSVRGDILAAARELFAEKGYRDTTVREIARRAGANGAAVNYYFRSKDALYEAVFDEAFETFGRPLGDLVGSVRDQATWRAALEKWFDFMLGLFLLDDPRQALVRRLVAQERSSPTEFCRQKLRLLVKLRLAVQYLAALGRRDLLWILVPEEALREVKQYAE